FKRAIELNPGYATTYEEYGKYLIVIGHFDEAIVELKRAQQLDPLSSSIGTHLGVSYHSKCCYDESIEHLKKTLDIEPIYFFAHYLLGLTYAKKKMINEAVEELEKAKQLYNVPLTQSGLGFFYARYGRMDEARYLFNEMIELSQRYYLSPYYKAIF